MGTEAPETPAAEAVDLAKLITIRPNGTLLYDGIAIGGLDLVDDDIVDEAAGWTKVPRLTLNAGWIRLAGLRFRVQDDPETDSHRDGLVLDR